MRNGIDESLNLLK